MTFQIKTAWFLFWILLVCGSAWSQNREGKSGETFVFDPVRHVRAENDLIRVVVDRSSGRFAVQTVGDRPLLFLRNDGMTSFTNIFLDGTVWTNNSLRGPQPPAGTIPMPRGRAELYGNDVVFRTTLTHREGDVKLTQYFIPGADRNYAFVRIRMVVKNTTPVPLPVGALYLLDVLLDNDDGPDLAVRRVMQDRERGFRGAAVPDSFVVTSARSTLHVRGRLNAPGLVKPDYMVVGRWQYGGYLGAVGWNYTPSGLSMPDRAVMLQWNERSVAPGDSLVVVTDYGYVVRQGISMVCTATDSVRFNDITASYEPDPFVVRTRVINTGNVMVRKPVVEIGPLPSGVTLIPGEIARKTLPDIYVGQFAIATWRLTPSLSPIDINTSIPVRFVSPGLLADSCRSSTFIEAVKTYRAELDCGARITLDLDSAQSEYNPNPFTISVRVTNTGAANLYGLTVTINLPPRLGLVGGNAVQAITPDPLPPGQAATVQYTVRALTETVSDTVRFRAELSSSAGRVREQCAQEVILPAIPLQTSCIQNGIDTRGTDFWVAIPPNSQGVTAPQPLLMMYAENDAVVKVYEDPASQTFQSVYVPAQTVRMIILPDRYSMASIGRMYPYGVHVVSDNPIALYMGNFSGRHSDASIVLPTHALGREYRLLAYNHSDDPTEYAVIVATEDKTEVTITPILDTETKHPGGVPYTLIYKRGDYYVERAAFAGKAGGLSGSLVQSNKPIVVVSGVETGWVPNGARGYLNPHFEQVIPNMYLGASYVLVPFLTRLNGDPYRITPVEDSTHIEINGIPQYVLMAGEMLDGIATEPLVIESDKPVLVAHFAASAEHDSIGNHYGDASMVYLTPTDRFPACHGFGTGPLGRFDSSFVNVVIEEGALGTVTIDGTLPPDSSFHRIPGSNYLYGRFFLHPGTHQVSTSSGSGVGAIVYGFEYHDAYTLNPGFLLRKKNTPLNTRAIPRRSAVTMSPAFPNPFTRTSRFSVVLPRGQDVRIAVYNTLGQRVTLLYKGWKNAGKYQFTLPGDDLPAGVYTIALATGNSLLTQRVLLSK